MTLLAHLDPRRHPRAWFAAGLMAICASALHVPSLARTCRPGSRPPLLQAVRADNVAEVRRLLAEGADPNRGRAPFNRECPLDVALERGHPEMIALLRAHGARTRVALMAERGAPGSPYPRRESSPPH